MGELQPLCSLPLSIKGPEFTTFIPSWVVILRELSHHSKLTPVIFLEAILPMASMPQQVTAFSRRMLGASSSGTANASQW